MLIEGLSDEHYRQQLQRALDRACRGVASEDSKPGKPGGGLSLSVVPLESIGSTMDFARDWRGPASAAELPRCACVWPDSVTDDGQRVDRTTLERLDAICFLAREQTQGRGREDRRWMSARDRGIYATFLFAPSCPPARLSGYSLVVGLAVQSALAKFGANLIVKWPNDLVLLRGDGSFQKVAGILVDSTSGSGCESRIGARGLRVCVGIGINILPMEHLPEDRPHGALQAASISELVASPVDLFTIFAEVAEQLLRTSREFFRSGFAPFREEWTRRSGFVGCDVILHPLQVSPSRAAASSGRVLGVDESGGVCLEHEGRRSIYYSGSLELVGFPTR